MPMSFEAKPIEPVSEPSAWSAPLLRSPSQRSIGWLMELKMVGECREVSAPRASGENWRRSAPQSRAGWQLAHAVLPSAETGVSQKSARPSSARGEDESVLGFSCPNKAAASRRSSSSARAAPVPTAIAAAISRILIWAPLPASCGRRCHHTPLAIEHVAGWITSQLHGDLLVRRIAQRRIQANKKWQLSHRCALYGIRIKNAATGADTGSAFKKPPPYLATAWPSPFPTRITLSERNALQL